MIERAKALLRRHEGFRSRVYLDTQQIPTVGYGRNLVDRGLTRKEVERLLSLVDLPRELAEEMLETDIRLTLGELQAHFPWFTTLDEVRQVVLIDMGVNLGISRLLGFRRALTALRLHQWEQAAVEMTSSLWARQVGKRANELSEMVRTGRYADEP